MQPYPTSYSKIILVLLTWLAYIIIIFAGRNHDNLYTYFANRAFLILASLITLIVFFRDNKRYKREQDIRAFAASITAISCVAVLLLTIWLIKLRDHSPTILFAAAGKIPYYSIDLRKDKTFKITKSSLFSREFIRGKYVFTDSILTLDSATAESALEAHRYMARTVPYNDSIGKSERSGLLTLLFGEQNIDTSARVSLIPIDARGTIIKNARHFHITWKPPGD